MAEKTWTFRLEDGEHTVHLEHSLWSGRRTVTLDDRPLVDETKKFNILSEYPFQVNGHDGLIRVRSNGLAYNYDAAVDGKSLTTGRPLQASLPMPAWGWVFVAACVLIPVIALGGVIPVIIGGVGAFACSLVARNASMATGTKGLSVSS